MNTKQDPLAMARQSRIKISHEANNDLSRMMATLRRQEVKYVSQIEEYRLSHAHVAEEKLTYGKR